MVSVRIATGAEQPINRDGAVSTVKAEEGDLVGLDANGDIVKADADSATAVPAVGVMYAPVEDPADYASVPEVQDIIESERATINNQRVAYGFYGAILENADEDWGFTPGEPVLLAAGGGFTQTEPAASSGDLRQVVGVATDDGESVMLNINPDYTVA